MKTIFWLILLTLLDDRAELRLSDDTREYVIGGVRYTVSAVCEAPDSPGAKTLRERVEHLVKSALSDLRSQPKHDTLKAEYVPAANTKGDLYAAEQ